MARLGVKWMVAAYFKMEAEPQQRISEFLIKIKRAIAQNAMK